MSRKNQRTDNCLNGVMMGAVSGFLVGGGMAGISVLGYSLVPSLRGQRMQFLRNVGLKIVLQGGGAFACFLGFGGLVRCL
ncbi:hypothetical protein ABK040_006006 [Willaertia magna]